MYLGDEVFVYKVPDSVPPTVAVLSELFTVTLGISAAKEVYSLANIGFGTFPSVLVLGVGPLGLLSIIRLRIMGCDKIVAMDWSAYRLAAAKRFGADSIIDMNEIGTRKERVEFTRQLTDGLGVDLAIDCANEPSAFSEGIDHLRRVGTLIELGNFVDTGEISIECFQPNMHKKRANYRSGESSVYRVRERSSHVRTVNDHSALQRAHFAHVLARSCERCAP